MGRERRSRPRKWSARETARLLSARKRGKTRAQCASMLGRTRKQVQNKLYKLGATDGNSPKGKQLYEIRWSAREDTVLKRHYGALGPTVLAERLGRTFQSVSTRAIRTGIAKPKPRWCYADVLDLLIVRAPASAPPYIKPLGERDRCTKAETEETVRNWKAELVLEATARRSGKDRQFRWAVSPRPQIRRRAPDRHGKVKAGKGVSCPRSRARASEGSIQEMADATNKVVIRIRSALVTDL